VVKAPTHAPFLGLALLSLLAALWAGWIRIGWEWPPIQASLPGVHGPLMVAGFLGTLIALERAVALRHKWMVLSPLFSGVGAIALILGGLDLAGVLFFTFGSIILVAIFYVIVRQHFVLYTVAMALGALAYAIGSLLWLSGWSIPRVTLWWQAFLVLTIAGERLELGRLIRFPRRVIQAFVISCALLLIGLLYSAFDHMNGTRLFSLGLLALAAWFLANDIARRTIQQAGLPRYTAICLLTGYVWLGVGGIIGILKGGQAAGPVYDAFVHTVMVGFVLSMIFGHAPIIFPAILSLPLGYTPYFYAPLVLLHGSLVLRIAGDLSLWMQLRQWGGLLNGIAVLTFLGIIAIAIANAQRTSID